MRLGGAREDSAVRRRGGGGLENVGRPMAKEAGKIFGVQQVAGCKVRRRRCSGGGSRSNGHSRERGSTEGPRERGRIALLQESFKRYLSVDRRTTREGPRKGRKASERFLPRWQNICGHCTYAPPSFSTSLRVGGSSRKEVRAGGAAGRGGGRSNCRDKGFVSPPKNVPFAVRICVQLSHLPHSLSPLSTPSQAFSK